MKITKEELVKKLTSKKENVINGASFISLEYISKVNDLVKPKSNPYNGVMKFIATNVQVFTNKKSNAYQNMVKRRLEKEGKDPENFKLQPRKWGERIQGTPLVEHKGAYYLEVIFLENTTTKYFFEGKEVSSEELKPYRRESKASGQGGLENQVQIRTIKLDSLLSITMNKEKYTIV